jgi:D-alanine--poly(phosphoribitol) ligase subunit 2
MENSMIKEKIQNFMEETFLLEFNEDITEDTDLFRSGIINSFGYIKLINFLEGEFNIKFSEEEVLSNVFVTFSSIVDCMTRKVQEMS